MNIKIIQTKFNETLVQNSYELNFTDESTLERPVENEVFNIYPQVAFQKITGFGGAMTDAAGYALSKLSDTDRKKAIEDYFGADGNGARIIRTHIDSCDFSVEMYQAVSDPMTDKEFAGFTIERDRKYIIPAIKDAMEASCEPLSVLLSPWSPPPCWKTLPFHMVVGASPNEELSRIMPKEKPTTGTRCWGGHLKPEFYGDWARYITKYIIAYLEEGIPVKWVTIQNEAGACTPWDSCQWTAEEEKVFLRDHLYPEMKKSGLIGKVGIYFWDHNKERVFERATATLDKDTAQMVEGIAFHWYSGDHFEAVDLVNKAFPNKELMFSEGCVGFSKDDPKVELTGAEKYAHDIIGNLNAGMNSWFDWNLYLDEKGGPNHVGNFCNAPIMLDDKGGYYKHLSYHYIGHFSRYIKPGAERIGFSRFTTELDMTAFKNPDGSIVAVILNAKDTDVESHIRINGKVCDVKLAKHSIVSVIID